MACLLFAGTGLAAAAQNGEPAPATAATQELPAGSHGLFVGSVDVDIVEVTVWVEDREGRPVHGLGPDDFELVEDGGVVPIANFLEVRGGREAVGAESAGEAEDVAGDPVVVPEEVEAAGTALPAEPGPVPAPLRGPLYLAVYIDNFSISPSNRRWALQAVERFLVGELGPRDQVMLVTYDRDLHVRQRFTGDRFAVAEAVRETLRVVAEQSSRDRERRMVLEEILTTRNPLQALIAAERHANEVELEIRRSLDALREVTVSLAGLEGRKAVLYVADGLPDVASQDLFVAVDQRFPNQGALVRAHRYDLAGRYREIERQANAAGVTIYTLDAQGQAGDAAASAEYSGMVHHATGANISAIEVARQQNQAAPMLAMAAATGGRAIQRTNALDRALAGIGSDFENFYSLGYRSRPGASARYHRIEVRTLRKDLRVRHRRGYLEKDAATRLREGTEAAVQHGMEANPLEIELILSPVERSGEDRNELPLEIRIPLGAVALVPDEQRHLGRLEVAVAVIDREGGQTPVLVQPAVDLDIPAADWENARQQYFSYRLRLAVRSGEQRVTVAVRDALAQLTSYVSQAFFVE